MRQKLEEYLGEFVYGAIDGTVTTFAVVAAAVGAGLSSTVVIILGIANLVGDGFSMGASAYLSAKSERDLKIKRGEKADDGETPLGDGIATFVAFVAIGFLPVLAYVFDAIFNTGLTTMELFVTSSVLTMAVFAGIGLLKARVTHTGKLRAAAETLALGAVAAGLAYGLGDLLERLLAGK